MIGRSLAPHMLPSGVCRHAKVDDLPAFVVQNDEDHEKPERGSRLCQFNRIHFEISVNFGWLLYAISMA